MLGSFGYSCYTAKFIHFVYKSIKKAMAFTARLRSEFTREKALKVSAVRRRDEDGD